jgi:adenosylcobinamide-GDP ribazoletransferase
MSEAAPSEPGLLNAVRREWTALLAAVQYFTRVPVPSWVGHSQHLLNAAARYFPAVGILVGAAAALTVWLAQQWLPLPIAVALSMAVTMLLTGGFHEDGWTDACDGLGGGFTRERALEIMKDSRIGAYGAMGLVILLLLKWQALSAMPANLLLAALIAASRLMAVIIMATLGYVREDESRAKPLVQGITPLSLLIAGLTGCLPLWLLGLQAVSAVVAALLVCLAWRAYLKHRLGGYTGDCLGAAQQLSEVTIYLALLVSPPHFA